MWHVRGPNPLRSARFDEVLVHPTHPSRGGTRPPTGDGAGRGPTPPAQPAHSTPAERAARGKSARGEVRRSVHADWNPHPIGRTRSSCSRSRRGTRIPELVPIRYGRMLLSPLAFFRGAAYVMTSDLAHAPRTGMLVHLSGDAHLSNFGVYAAPDRRLGFRGARAQLQQEGARLRQPRSGSFIPCGDACPFGDAYARRLLSATGGRHDRPAVGRASKRWTRRR
jgi:hypothetical protein